MGKWPWTGIIRRQFGVYPAFQFFLHYIFSKTRYCSLMSKERKLIMYSEDLYSCLETEVDVLTVIISDFPVFLLQTLQTSQRGV